MSGGPRQTLPGERQIQKDHAIDRERNETMRARYLRRGPENTFKALGLEFGLTAARVHQIVKGRRR
jgi:DNA-directed RNA polymerase sigma subunit (sigma70/sigma32)